METTITIKIKIDDKTEILLNYEDGLKLFNQLKEIYSKEKTERFPYRDHDVHKIYGPIAWPKNDTFTTNTNDLVFLNTSEIKK